MSQGDEVLVIALVVAAGVALVQIAISLAVRYGNRPRWLRISRQRALIASLVAIAILVPALVAAKVPGEISDQWENFKSRGTAADPQDRGAVLTDTSSSGRYQFWMSAEDANSASPLKGIGPGTFEYHWAQDPDNFGYVRNAHSLYFENFAELGWIGLILIVTVVGGALALGAWRSFRGPPAARARIAAATAGVAGFAVGAGLDWVWEIPALPAIFILLAAVLATDREPDETSDIHSRRSSRRRSSRSRRRSRSSHSRSQSQSPTRRILPRIAIVIAGVAALWAIWPPLQANLDLRSSHIAVADDDLPSALAAAEDAAGSQPEAAAPLIQKAIVLELEGRYEEAADTARAAAKAEPVNWRNWVTLARLDARSGNVEDAVRAYRKSEKLNP